MADITTRLRSARSLVLCAAVTLATLGGIGAVGNAEANGETRSLTIKHMHTGETATITYKRSGQFDRAGLEKLNWMLRDWRRDEPISMDPRLFDVVWETTRAVGTDEPIHVVSGYRSPTTNAMLRRRSKAVAKSSQHMLGKAMDFYLTDVSMAQVRDVGMRMQRGGVGYYPTAYTPFVHIDAGSVRHWPKMSRDQLTRLFPDGKTVHVPSDGTPLPRYQEAYAEVLANGGTVNGYSGSESDESTAVASSGGKSKGLFAWLFGGGEDEDEVVQAPRGRRQLASRNAPQQVVASANMDDQTSPLAALRQAETIQTRRGGSRFEDQSVSATPDTRTPSAIVAPAVIKPTLPAVAAAEARAAQPLQRSGPPLPEMVWQTGAAPLPPTARGNAQPLTAIAAVSSLSMYRPASVPLPPVSNRPVIAVAQAAPVQMAALVGTPTKLPLPTSRPVELRSVASAEPVAVGPAAKHTGYAQLPSVITGGTEKTFEGAALAYTQTGIGAAPMPPTRPGSEKSDVTGSLVGKKTEAKKSDAKPAEKAPAKVAALKDTTPKPISSGLLTPKATAPTEGFLIAPNEASTGKFVKN